MFALVLVFAFAFSRARAAEPFQFRTNDVIAFVGGEDVVEMQHNGYLELLLTTALPHHKLRFRNIAFEGDTVFEQHRQLNFPSWEKQLERIGATVVIAQFGQAESLEGTNGLGKFVEAYGKLVDRFTNGGKRIVLLAPTPFETVPSGSSDPNTALQEFTEAARRVAAKRNAAFFDTFSALRPKPDRPMPAITRDGLHLNHRGALVSARMLCLSFSAGAPWRTMKVDPQVGTVSEPGSEKLRQLILAKNRLWFDYWRPQNWAFLHGDRTEQQSSRDHRDPKKRWFPEEMEKFLPLIEAKEKEIWKLAEELN